jgi:DNA (cytosine-5)-methyltransferase 1
MPRFAEFFAGAGMVSAALRPGWDLAFANDIDPKKCFSYRRNWGPDGLIEGDIADLDAKFLRQPIDLYWASSPCQDLSLAGRRLGLAGMRSGMFFAWMDLVRKAKLAGFAPRILAFENVTGLITSNGGSDFLEVIRAFQENGYRCGALEIDARWYLPQSRPRVFVLAVRDDVVLPNAMTLPNAGSTFHTPRLARFVSNLPTQLQSNWLWWNIDRPLKQPLTLNDLIEVDANGLYSSTTVETLLHMMDNPSVLRISQAREQGGLHIGTIYKRGRPDQFGCIRQRAEVRMDGLAGCLRTPAGGSSRQTLLIVKEGEVFMRLLHPREAIRLMGLPESYVLPTAYNDAYKLAGDGVAVPVVQHLDSEIFSPILKLTSSKRAA